MTCILFAFTIRSNVLQNRWLQQNIRFGNEILHLFREWAETGRNIFFQFVLRSTQIALFCGGQKIMAVTILMQPKIQPGQDYLLDGKTLVRVLKPANRSQTVFNVEIIGQRVESVDAVRLSPLAEAINTVEQK
jgi:hypothetical protein